MATPARFTQEHHLSKKLAQGSLLVRRVEKSERAPLSRMLELYQYELSEIWDQDLDIHGEYTYPIDKFWSDPKCSAFMFLVDSHYAGFALVDGLVSLPENQWWMAQFFVLRKYRRRGVGAVAAVQIFNEIRGRWEIGQMPGNLDGQAFWRRVVRDYTGGGFVEHDLDDQRWHGTLQCFDNSEGR